MGKWLSELRQKNQEPYGEALTKLPKGGFRQFCQCGEVGIPEKQGGEDLFNAGPPALPAHVGDWPEEWLEAYIERVGTMEFDGGLLRAVAERRAEVLVREGRRRAQERGYDGADLAKKVLHGEVLYGNG